MADLLYQLINHHARWWIVITGTGMIGLVLLWPAVDDYLAVKSVQDELNESLAKMKQGVDRLDHFANLVSQKKSALELLEAKAQSDKTVGQFRNRVVQLVRQSGCKMRRVRLGPPSWRRWRETDDPFTWKSVADAGAETQFDLRTQLLSISLTGSVKQISNFLTKIHQLDSFIHTMNLSLQRSHEGGKSAVLELDLLLLNLTMADDMAA